MAVIRRFLEYAAYRTFALILPLLPRGAMVWTGRRLGAAYWAVSARSRRVAQSE